MRNQFIGPLLPGFPRGYHNQLWLNITSCQVRLINSGKYGLPIGPGTKHLGGVRTDWALRKESSGVAYIKRDYLGKLKRIYPRQLLFEFMYDIR